MLHFVAYILGNDLWVCTSHILDMVQNYNVRWKLMFGIVMIDMNVCSQHCSYCLFLKNSSYINYNEINFVNLCFNFEINIFAIHTCIFM